MTGPKTYLSKPSEIEALQWDGTNGAAVQAWAGADAFRYVEERTDAALAKFGDLHPSAVLYVAANEAWLDLDWGEWVARDEHGFYPIKADVFERKYEPKWLHGRFDPLDQAIAAVQARNAPPPPPYDPATDAYPDADRHH
jgi:hypothetical protein